MATTPKPAPTPERKLEVLIHSIESDLQRAETTLADFAAKLAADPADAFAWGRAAMQAAAEREVLPRLLRVLRDDDGGLIAARKLATDSALQMARNPASSTSALSNLMEQNKLAAWAAFLQRVEWA